MCGTALSAASNDAEPDESTEQARGSPLIIPAYDRDDEQSPTQPAMESLSERTPASFLCPLCNNANPITARWCLNCGYALPDEEEVEEPQVVSHHPERMAPVGGSLICPRCHHRNESESAFCVNCGLPFDGEGTPKYAVADPRIGPTGTPFQGFWIRLFAFLVDFVVIQIAFLVALAVTGSWDTYWAEEGWTDIDSYSVLAGIVYDIVCVGTWGATFGKYIVGIKIVRFNGHRVGYGRAVGRHFASYLSGLFLGIGYLMVAFSPDKRALHDLIAGTVVVRRR